jgi:hypothetical protein
VVSIVDKVRDTADAAMPVGGTMFVGEAVFVQVLASGFLASFR